MIHILYFSMLDIGLKETNKSCDPFVPPTHAGAMQYLALIMYGLINGFYSILFIGETPRT